MATTTPIGKILVVVNSTLQDERPAEEYKDVWIASQILSLLMLFTCSWSIAAFYKYGHRKRRWDTSNRQEFALMLLAITTPIMTLLRLISTQVVIVIGLISAVDQRGNISCTVSMDCCKVLYTLSSVPTYLYFWKRQQVLYSQVLLIKLNTTFVKVLSYAAVLLIAGGSLGVTALFIEFDYRISDVGCVPSSSRSRESAHSQIPIFVAGAVLVTAQLWIFGLFVYPLRTLQFNKQVERNVSVMSRSNENLRKQLRRANVLATMSMAISTVSDLFVMLMVSTVVPSSMPICLSLTLYDFSLMVNIFSLMLSNKDFRKTVLED